MASAETSPKFCCKYGRMCSLTEEVITCYEQNEYQDILDVLEDHGIDKDKAESFSEAQNLLFEHLKLQECDQMKHGAIDDTVDFGGDTTMTSAETVPEFHCDLGRKCSLTEEEIRSYNQNEYNEILDVLDDHGIDVDKAESFIEAQKLLFEHLKLRECDRMRHGARDDTVKTDVVQQAVGEHNRNRENLLTLAQELQKFLDKLPESRKKELKRYFPDMDVRMCKAIEELQEEKFSFIVAGESGSGKSCFINLLMGHTKQDFLPVSNCPSTSCLCEISYGEEPKLKAYRSGSATPEVEKKLSRQNMTKNLSYYTHQKEGREKGILYSLVQVQWPLDWLKNGLTIVDSPGVGESAEITEMVKARMPDAYGFIYIINTTNAGGIQQGELEDLLFNHTATKQDDSQEGWHFNNFDPRTAIFVFNKWDQVPNEEKQKVKQFVQGKLQSMCNGFDPENQMFFLSTQMAAAVYEKNQYITDDYRQVLRGLERLFQFSMKNKLRRQTNFFQELLSRFAYILKSYISNFGDTRVRYVEAKERLQTLESRSKELKKSIKDMLKEEVEHIVDRLREHMTSTKTKERLCLWHLNDCPQNIQNWNHLSRLATAQSQERVLGEIKRWENQNKIFQQANTKLMDAFKSQFVSLKQNLGNIENNIVGDNSGVSNKELQRVLGNISHRLKDDDDDMFNTTEKVAIGVTAPLWIPVAILAAPFVLGYAVREVMQDEKKEKAYYEKYLLGPSSELPQLMQELTEKSIESSMKGEPLRKHINEKMQDIVRKMLALVNKIPEFVKADQQLLSDMQQQCSDGSNSDTRDQCSNLSDHVARLQNELDFFFLDSIRENDISLRDLVEKDLIASGSFGQVFRGMLTCKERKDEQEVTERKVAIKRILKPLAKENATEIRMEDENSRKLECDNIVKYFGLIMKKNRDNLSGDTVMMVMEFCDTTLQKIIYDTKLYIGPGTLQPSDPRRSDRMRQMTDFAVQLANGLQVMHTINLAHRDLKPENILVEEIRHSDQSVQYVLKLCDFGLTKDEELITKTYCGTPLYMAPEVSYRKSYDKSSDIYSYGLILLECFYGCMVIYLPHVHMSVKPTSFSGDPLGENQPPEEMKAFMTSCFAQKPEDRPTANECLEFFKKEYLEIGMQ